MGKMDWKKLTSQQIYLEFISFLIEPTDYSTLKGKYILEVDSIFSLTDNQKRIYRKELPSQTLYNLWEASIKHKSAIDNFVNQHPQHYIIETIKMIKKICWSHILQTRKRY